MGLQPHDTVDHADTRILEGPGPADVGLLVEAGLQLHDNGDLLARLGRLDESRHDGGVIAGSVQGLLDGQHGGIGSGRSNELDDRTERVIRVVKKHVVLPDRGEEVLELLTQREVGGVVRHILQVRSRGRGPEHHQAIEVDRALDAVDVLLPQAVDGLETLDNVFVSRCINFEPDDIPLSPSLELSLYGLEKVIGLLLVQVEIAVPRDPEGGGPEDVIAPEEFGRMGPNEVGKKYVVHAIPFFLPGKPDYAGQKAGNRHDAQEDLTIVIFEEHGQTEGLVDDAREGMCGIQREGGQNRVKLIAAVFLNELPLGI